MLPKFDRPHLSLQLPIDLVRIVETTVLLRLTNSIFQLETFHCYHTAVIDHHHHSLQLPVGLVRTVDVTTVTVPTPIRPTPTCLRPSRVI